VAGDLLSSGERVLAVCADVSRRRRSFERLVGGIGAHVEARDGAGAPGRLALVEWDALAEDPQLAEDTPHLLAVDPPATAAAQRMLDSAPTRFVHKAWGLPEIDFAQAVARSRLDIRGALTALYRCLRDEPPRTPEELERTLRGEGAHPRPPQLAARLVLVLSELGLARYDAAARTCVVLQAQRTSLERSPSHRVAREALAEAERRLERERSALQGPRLPAEAHVTL
jgi:hypothetical protein